MTRHSLPKKSSITSVAMWSELISWREVFLPDAHLCIGHGRLQPPNLKLKHCWHSCDHQEILLDHPQFLFKFAPQESHSQTGLAQYIIVRFSTQMMIPPQQLGLQPPLHQSCSQSLLTESHLCWICTIVMFFILVWFRSLHWSSLEDSENTPGPPLSPLLLCLYKVEVCRAWSRRQAKEWPDPPKLCKPSTLQIQVCVNCFWLSRCTWLCHCCCCQHIHSHHHSNCHYCHNVPLSIRH